MNPTIVSIQTFATNDNMNLFWGYIKSLLSYASPWVMIAFAILTVGILLTVVITSFKKADKATDEDEIEIKNY